MPATIRQLKKGEALRDKLEELAHEVGAAYQTGLTRRAFCASKALLRAARELRALDNAKDDREGRNAVAWARRALKQAEALLNE